MATVVALADTGTMPTIEAVRLELLNRQRIARARATGCLVPGPARTVSPQRTLTRATPIIDAAVRQYLAEEAEKDRQAIEILNRMGLTT